MSRYEPFTRKYRFVREDLPKIPGCEIVCAPSIEQALVLRVRRRPSLFRFRSEKRRRVFWPKHLQRRPDMVMILSMRAGRHRTVEDRTSQDGITLHFDIFNPHTSSLCFTK